MLFETRADGILKPVSTYSRPRLRRNAPKDKSESKTEGL